jgi:hypothetical protein
LRFIAFLLLIGVFVRHDSSAWIADLLGANQKAVFYVQGGLWEAVLACVIAWLVPKGPYRYMVLMACIIEITEGLQMAVCQSLTASASGNLCDNLTGFPIGATLTALYTFNICYFSRFDMMKLPMILIPLIASAEVAYLVHPAWGAVVLAVCIALRNVGDGRTF